MPKFALAQINACADPEKNLQRAAEFAAEAAAAKADLLLLPEFAMGYPDRGGAPIAGQPLSGAFVTGLRALARQYGMWLVCGIFEESGQPARPYNTAVVIDRAGEVRGTHRKAHLYDAFSYRESDDYVPGDRLTAPIETEFGRIAVQICYELRFPEPARLQALAGTDYLLYPSAFVCGPTKAAAWHTLLAARAIENDCFVLGDNHVKHHVFLGESAAYDPFGTCLGKLDGEREGLLLVDCDPAVSARAREVCPVLTQRRTDLYRLEAVPSEGD